MDDVLWYGYEYDTGFCVGAFVLCDFMILLWIINFFFLKHHHVFFITLICLVYEMDG